MRISAAPLLLCVVVAFAQSPPPINNGIAEAAAETEYEACREAKEEANQALKVYTLTMSVNFKGGRIESGVSSCECQEREYDYVCYVEWKVQHIG